MHCDGGLIVVVYYFQIWNKKEHKIISSRVISSQIGHMYIEKPYIKIFLKRNDIWQMFIDGNHTK